MKRIVTNLLLLLLLHPFNLAAQAPLISWQKCVGSPYLDYGNSVVPTPDGGSITVGYVEGIGGDVITFNGEQDYFIVKQDATGAVQWTKSLGGPFQDMATVVRLAADGGYLIGGEMSTPSGSGDVGIPAESLDIWIVKLDAAGNILWERSYGSAQNDYLGDMQPTSDGGMVFVGSTQAGTGEISGNHGGYDIWIAKIAADGTMTWDQCFGGSQDDWGYGIAVAPGGAVPGYVISGWTASNDDDASDNHGGHDLMAIKVDNNGYRKWVSVLGGSDRDEGYGVTQTSDGNYVFAGLTGSNDGDVAGNHGSLGMLDAWVLKLDQAGNIIWQHCYGGTNNESARSVTLTAAKNLVIAGTAQSADYDLSTSCMPANIPGSGLTAGWVFEINQNSYLLWNKVLSGGNVDSESYAIEKSDGSILVSGYTAKSNVPGYHADASAAVGDIYTAKLSFAKPAVSINIPPAGSCVGVAVTFTAAVTGPGNSITYQWFKNGVDQKINAVTYSASDFANGDQVYCQISVTDNGCAPPIKATSNTVILAVSSTMAPVVSIAGNAAPVCAGTSVSFNATVTGGSGSGTYQWLVNGNPVGSNTATYSSTALNNGDLVSCGYTDAGVCSAAGQVVSNTIDAQVQPNITASVQIAVDANVICMGTTAKFTATAVGGGTTPGYQWMVGSTPVGTGQTYSSSGLATGDVVTCQLTNSAACVSPNPATSNAITMTVNTVLNAGVSLAYSPQVVCSGKPMTFEATATDAGASPSYQWSVNGSPVTATGSNGAQFTSNTLVTGDVVSVGVSDPAAGCVIPAQTSASVTVYPNPTVGPGGTVSVTKGQSYTLDLPVTGDIASYSWSPDTWLNDNKVATPVATPPATTEYTLTVTTGDGCVASDSILVKVSANSVVPRVSIPSAFSPNGDGHNDVFYVVGAPAGAKVGDMVIFNRWGVTVFAVHGVGPGDPANGWNGNVNGQPAPTGTYVYEVRMVFAEGGSQVYKGTVVLVR